MNLENEYFLSFWGYLERHSFYILASAKHDGIDDDTRELKGVINKIKDNQKIETSYIKNMVEEKVGKLAR